MTYVTDPSADMRWNVGFMELGEPNASGEDAEPIAPFEFGEPADEMEKSRYYLLQIIDKLRLNINWTDISMDLISVSTLWVTLIFGFAAWELSRPQLHEEYEWLREHSWRVWAAVFFVMCGIILGSVLAMYTLYIGPIRQPMLQRVEFVLLDKLRHCRLEALARYGDYLAERLAALKDIIKDQNMEQKHGCSLTNRWSDTSTTLIEEDQDSESEKPCHALIQAAARKLHWDEDQTLFMVHEYARRNHLMHSELYEPVDHRDWDAIGERCEDDVARLVKLLSDSTGPNTLQAMSHWKHIMEDYRDRWVVWEGSTEILRSNASPIVTRDHEPHESTDRVTIVVPADGVEDENEGDTGPGVLGLERNEEENGAEPLKTAPDSRSGLTVDNSVSNEDVIGAQLPSATFCNISESMVHANKRHNEHGTDALLPNTTPDHATDPMYDSATRSKQDHIGAQLLDTAHVDASDPKNGKADDDTRSLNTTPDDSSGHRSEGIVDQNDTDAETQRPNATQDNTPGPVTNNRSRGQWVPRRIIRLAVADKDITQSMLNEIARIPESELGVNIRNSERKDTICKKKIAKIKAQRQAMTGEAKQAQLERQKVTQDAKLVEENESLRAENETFRSTHGPNSDLTNLVDAQRLLKKKEEDMERMKANRDKLVRDMSAQGERNKADKEEAARLRAQIRDLEKLMCPDNAAGESTR